jgi:hypothetical protein
MISTEASPASGGESPPNSVTGIKRKHINYDDVDEGNAYQNDDDDPMKKGKTKASSSSEKVSTITDEGSPVKKARKGKKKKGGDDDGEKRLRRFRKHAPTSYLEIKERALSQRLTVINRERCGTDELPEEKVTIAGSTGNLYTVNIGLVPKCDCPHAKKGNQCKHIIYVSTADFSKLY